MRDIALTFLGYFTILAAYNNSDDAERPVVPVPTGNIAIYITISSLIRNLTHDTVNFSLKGNLAPTIITLNPVEQYQTMDDFGAAITGSTCYNLLLIKPADRHTFLTKTFFDKDGFGFSYIRISVGCSDFPLSEYTCCDTKGIGDFVLQSEEKDYILPTLKETLAINLSIKVAAALWTCPKWVKVRSPVDHTLLDSQMNGQLNPDYYQDCATYFVKWIQVFKAEGIDIYAVTPQNKLLNRGNSVSLYIEWEERRDFAKTALGPQMRVAGLSTKIYVFDHNYNYDNIESQKNHPGRIYKDAAASQYLAGTVYYNYGSSREELLDIHQAYPEEELPFIKAPIGVWNSGRDLSGRLMEDMERVVLGTIDNWCKGIIVWNLMFDNGRGPNREGGCQTCYGAVDTNNSDYKIVIRNSHYYIIAHLPSVVKPGAVCIATAGYADSDITYSAFENTNGTYAFILTNNNEKPKEIIVSDGQRHLAYDVPGKSVTPYRWAKSK